MCTIYSGLDRKGWIAGKVLKSKAEVYFEVAAKEEADTVILYDKMSLMNTGRSTLCILAMK